MGEKEHDLKLTLREKEAIMWTMAGFLGSLALSIVIFVFLVACGTTPVPIETPTPGLKWTPVAGIVLTATDKPDLYEVEITCKAWLDFATQTISEIDQECEISNYEGTALFLVTREQIQQNFDYWRRYRGTDIEKDF